MSDTPPKRPNILIFLVDQMPYDVVAPGHPCHMPNARRMADEGVSFTRTLAPSPHCCREAYQANGDDERWRALISRRQADTER